MPAVRAGVRRLGSSRINWYLVEDESGVTVVDAGIPGYWPQLEAELAAIGRGMDDVRALVLTHAHSDHTGVAGKLHERGVPVYLHAGDEELLRTGKEPWKREGSALPAVRHPRTWSFLVHLVRNGALSPPKIPDSIAIAGGEQLDVPGRPRVIHAPGHTPGLCALHFETHDTLFVGDLLYTWHPILGRRGPQIGPAAFNVSSAQCLESLSRIEEIQAPLLLTGHGEPWTQGPAAAVALARERGTS